MFAEVPVLPVVIPIAVAAFAVLIWHLCRRQVLTWPSGAVAFALSVYVAGIVANTVFPIYLDKPARSAPWEASINVTPLGGYEVVDAVTNICVFVPFGMLLALALPTRPWRGVLAAAAMLSFGIELSQLATAHLLGGGHIADINDFVFNVVGAVLGCALLYALAQVSPGARLIDRFRWA